MNVRLELVHKKAKVKKVLLKSDTVIGRSSECGLRIASNEVSRQHCKICIGEDGVTVRDLGSSNGTFVNGYQLEPETDYEIAPDSELSLGGIKFFVRFSEPAGKAMRADGLGSTVDLKPEEYAALEETVSLDTVEDDQPAEAAEEDVEFAEADSEDAAEETSAEAQAGGEAGPVPMALPVRWTSSGPEGSDVEMSTHGDSAILEREDENIPIARPVASPIAQIEEVAEEDVVDMDLVEDADEPVSETGNAEAESGEAPASETGDEIYEAEDEIEEDEVYEAEDETEEEPVSQDDAETAEVKVPEAESATEEMDEEDVAAETDQADVAAFLNQVAEDDTGAADDDEPLGDFFKQFDN